MEQPDFQENWTDHLSIFPNQLSADSKVRIITESGSQYEFQKCTDRSLHPWITDNHVIVTEQGNPDLVGRFGFPIRGFQKGKRVIFCEGHELHTTPIKTLKGFNIGPDLVHEHVVTLIRSKFRTQMVELLKHELEPAKAWSSSTNLSHFFNDLEHPLYKDDPEALQLKVSALIMDIMKGDFVNQLQHPLQLRAMALDLSDFVTYRMWSPHGQLINLERPFEDFTLRASFAVDNMNANLLEVSRSRQPNAPL